MLLRGSVLIALAAGALSFSHAPAEAAGARTLRVCADPNNLPFSNRKREGFENKLLEMIAADLGETVSYTWWAQRRGNVRRTVKAGRCDVIPGVAAGIEMLDTTRPYYRSTYVLVSRAEDGGVSSLKDEKLRKVRVGVQLIGDDGFNTPPAHALAQEGIVQNVRGYTVYGDYGKDNPSTNILKAVSRGEVDVAAVWGPLAGYFASSDFASSDMAGKLEVKPISDPQDFPNFPLQFDIAMGVRRGNEALKAELNTVLERRQTEITKLLQSYGVPLVTASNTAKTASNRVENPQ